MFDAMSDVVGQVYEKVPCRRQQVQLLTLLFGQVNFVSAFSHHASGVTGIVGFLSSTLSYLNLLSMSSTRLHLYLHIYIHVQYMYVPAAAIV